MKVMGTCLAKEDEEFLFQHLGQALDITPCIQGVGPELSEVKDLWPRIQEHQAVLSRLVPSHPWPQTPELAASVLSHTLVSAQSWLLKNLVGIAAFRAMVYVVDEVTLRNIDLTTVLVACRMVGGVSVGILPPEARTIIDTTQLTLTTAIVGAQEPRAVSALLQTLTKESTSSG
jgi:hypothetical protein